jgi:hypothetical protein
MAKSPPKFSVGDQLLSQTCGDNKQWQQALRFPAGWQWSPLATDRNAPFVPTPFDCSLISQQGMPGTGAHPYRCQSDVDDWVDLPEAIFSAIET